jgi:hypothetical protein
MAMLCYTQTTSCILRLCCCATLLPVAVLLNYITPPTAAAVAAAAAVDADGSALLYAGHILQPATVLLRHLAAVGCEAGRDRSASRDNLRFISELMKRWGSKVALTGVPASLFLRGSQRRLSQRAVAVQTRRCAFIRYFYT